MVSTKGRSEELSNLLGSLAVQSVRDFEVIVVDQNDEPVLEPLLRGTSFALSHLRRPGERGLSRGRNAGWARAAGEYVLFPDDDCWYGPEFLRRARDTIDRLGADVLTGRAADEIGRSINGRFETKPQRITRERVWTTQIEWVAFFRRALLEQLGGFDETLGVGASSPWQSCEGQDIVLRALEHGAVCWYDPELYGHHAEMNVGDPDRGVIAKGRAYGRGMGFVLRKHRFSWLDRAGWINRPLLRAAQSLLQRRANAAAYYLNVALGRLEGAFGRSPRPGTGRPIGEA